MNKNGKPLEKSLEDILNALPAERQAKIKLRAKELIAQERKSMEKVYWVYILQCDNDTYYTGYTSDLAKRYDSHINGKGRCKYTKSFKPLYIAQCWKINGEKAFAMQIERAIKKLSRSEKEKIIENPASISTDVRIEIADKQIISEINSQVSSLS